MRTIVVQNVKLHHFVDSHKDKVNVHGILMSEHSHTFPNHDVIISTKGEIGMETARRRCRLWRRAARLTQESA